MQLRYIISFSVFFPIIAMIFKEQQLEQLFGHPWFETFFEFSPLINRFGAGSSNQYYCKAIAVFFYALFFAYIVIWSKSIPFWKAQNSYRFMNALFFSGNGKFAFRGLLVAALAVLMVLSDLGIISFVSIFRWEMFGRVIETPISHVIFNSRILVALFTWGMTLILAAIYYIVLLIFAGIVAKVSPKRVSE